MIWRCYNTKIILAATSSLGPECKGATSAIWMLKALGQLIDHRVYHAKDAAVTAAGEGLLPGSSHMRCVHIARPSYLE